MTVCKFTLPCRDRGFLGIGDFNKPMDEAKIMAFFTANRYRRTRRLFAETLETRALMAGDIAHNFLFPQDVDDDGAMTPLDALVVINDLNRGGDRIAHTGQIHDVDDDSQETPLDALIIINALNQQSASAGTKHEQSAKLTSATTSARVRVELESTSTQSELSIRMDNAPASKSLPVTINDIALGQLITDDRGRGKLVLSRGDDNAKQFPLPSSLSTLSPDMELAIGDIVRAKLTNLSSDDGSAGGSSGGNNSAPSSLNLAASFALAGNSSASSEYEQETENGVTKRSFQVEIEDAIPGNTIDVTVNSVNVGTIVINSKGKGKMSFATQPKSGEQLMDSSFPAIGVGTTISVGNASSTFHRIG